MASIFPGYEYDIFISYRQKDNRSDRWVTNFVKALSEELDASFKEEISIYFDVNPHDGLLETHDVDGSLKEKIKCIVFIPIVSHTYCDINSFAWKNELIAFRDFAHSDPNGLDIRLLDGNVAKRILPVRIHDIDKDDSSLLEREIGGKLRPVDFIYKEPGVNRPLRLSDDRSLNLEKTDYKNQVNKVANAVLEITRGLRTEDRLKPGQPQNQKINLTQSPLQISKSIVVLPFENMSNDPSHEYFSDGLTEELIADLSKLSSLHVISRTSAMVFKGSKKDVRTIGQELNVRYVLEGSVRKDGNKLRITAQLIDAMSDTHLWAEKFNGVLDDVFDIQEKVSHAIVDSLRLELTPQERERLVVKSPADPAAHELYLEGRHHLWQTTPSEMIKAIGLFEATIQRDPGYALAYAALANCYAYLGFLGAVAAEVYPKAKQAASKAVEIDEALAEPHAVLGYAATYYDWDWATAERELEHAIALNPNYAQGYLHYSWYLYSQDRIEESRAAMQRAKELDPLSLVIRANLSNYELFSRDYDGAIVQSRKALEFAPDAPLVLLFHGLACWGKELYHEAVETFKKCVDLTGGGPNFKGYLGYSHAKTGHRAEALSILSELTVLSKTAPVPAFQFAFVHLGLGQFEEALTQLEKAFEERGSWFPHIRHMGMFDPLHGYPRFQNLVRSLSFTEKI